MNPKERGYYTEDEFIKTIEDRVTEIYLINTLDESVDSTINCGFSNEFAEVFFHDMVAFDEEKMKQEYFEPLEVDVLWLPQDKNKYFKHYYYDFKGYFKKIILNFTTDAYKYPAFKDNIIFKLDQLTGVYIEYIMLTEWGDSEKQIHSISNHMYLNNERFRSQIGMIMAKMLVNKKMILGEPAVQHTIII